MVEWEVTTISTEFDLFAGGDLLKDYFSRVKTNTHKYPIYANALQKEGLYGYTSLPRYKGNSITITGRGDVGVAMYRATDFDAIVRLLVLLPKANNKADSRFTTYLIQTCVDFPMESTGVPQLTVPQIRDVELTLPPLPEQHRIAAVLSDTDNLITTLEKLIAKKKAIKQGAMQELLTGKRRLKGFGGEWESTTLGNILIGKPTYGINAPACEYAVGLPQYIRITDITEDGCYSKDDVMFVNAINSDYYFLNNNDIVLARTGASVGKSYLYNKKDGQLVFAGFLIKISIDANKANSKYIFECLHTKYYWDWVQMTSMRSGQPGINSEQYALFEILLPTLEEQTAIAEILSDMDVEIDKLTAKLNKYRQIKQGMMSELLTGRIRLTEDVQNG